jgi:ribonuclease-3
MGWRKRFRRNIVKSFEQWLIDEGYQPKNKELYEEACTHSSYANEHSHVHDNERLEFMGDAVLQIWSADELYNMKPSMPEGQMTTLRAQTVCEATLAKLNEQLGWYRFLKLGIGEEKTGGRSRKSILADQFEACIGAMYQDMGYEACDRLLKQVMRPVFRQEKGDDVTDYKTHLQEVIQAESRKAIQYRLLEETGPSNAPTFTMGVYLDDILLGKGTSTTKKKAEQKAAKDAFEKMAR